MPPVFSLFRGISRHTASFAILHLLGVSGVYNVKLFLFLQSHWNN